ncbi:MAG: hypothetical protein FJ271_31990 [Planctomycetes bacterium]|nr:hypothetical protein [Planctomycetota bacterium]
MRETSITEAGILERVVQPQSASFTPEAAKCLLEFRFDAPTKRRIRFLLQRNNRGTISASQRLALEKYLRVGQFLDLLHAKAHLSLKKNGRHS